MIYAIDFDGTCVTHRYPEIGADVGAVSVLKRLVDEGHKLILYTMRSGKTLHDAVEWFSNHDIPLWGVNRNPEQHTWSASPKVYAHRYIDDAAMGVPLQWLSGEGRPSVNWTAIAELLWPAPLPTI